MTPLGRRCASVSYVGRRSSHWAGNSSQENKIQPQEGRQPPRCLHTRGRRRLTTEGIDDEDRDLDCEDGACTDSTCRNEDGDWARTGPTALAQPTTRGRRWLSQHRHYLRYRRHRGPTSLEKDHDESQQRLKENEKRTRLAQSLFPTHNNDGAPKLSVVGAWRALWTLLNLRERRFGLTRRDLPSTTTASLQVPLFSMHRTPPHQHSWHILNTASSRFLLALCLLFCLGL